MKRTVRAVTAGIVLAAGCSGGPKFPSIPVGTAVILVNEGRDIVSIDEEPPGEFATAAGTRAIVLGDQLAGDAKDEDGSRKTFLKLTDGRLAGTRCRVSRKDVHPLAK